MKASETKLRLLIEGTKQFIVPLFQREYSWDKKEWNTLWDDILSLVNDSEARGHFLGSLVTMPVQSVPQGVAKYLLIDGQQRLTTIFILLSVLRDRSRSDQGTLAPQIEELFLTNRFQSDLDAYKVLPTQVDRDAFTHVIRGTTPESGSRVRQAYDFFDKRLKAQNAPGAELVLDAIIDRLVLVSIVLESDDNPHLIFESLNAKGRSLSQSDLIRNYFLMRVHVDHQSDLYESYWEPIQSRLGDTSTEFIRHFLMMNGGVVKQGDVYLFLKSRAEMMDEKSTIQYLKEIHRHSLYYSKLLRPLEEPSKTIREGLIRLNRIEVTTAYPLLLNVYRDYDTGLVSEGEFSAVIGVLENFLVRRFVCGVARAELNSVFPTIYSQASVNRSLLDGLKAALSTKNYPGDAAFREKLTTTRLYGGGDRVDKTKLVLERLEEQMGHKEMTAFSALTIEHVMPQTLTDQWRDELGEDWETVHSSLLDTIGNLTLTGYNSSLSNLPFNQKRERLLESHVSLNTAIASSEAWNESAIRLRGEQLAAAALTVWPYFGSIGTEFSVESGSSVTGKTPATVVILGQSFPTKTWRDVAEYTLKAIFDLDEDQFRAVADQFPRFISKDSTRFRSSRAIADGLCFDTNLSATSIYRLCTQFTQLAEIGPSDWYIEYA